MASLIRGLFLVAIAMSRWRILRVTVNECHEWPGILLGDFWEQPGKLIGLLCVTVHMHTHTHDTFTRLSAVMTTRGVCGTWRSKRRSSIRKATVKESMISTSTLTDHWLPLGKYTSASCLNRFFNWFVINLSIGWQINSVQSGGWIPLAGCGTFGQDVVLFSWRDTWRRFTAWTSPPTGQPITDKNVTLGQSEISKMKQVTFFPGITWQPEVVITPARFGSWETGSVFTPSPRTRTLYLRSASNVNIPHLFIQSDQSQ